MKKATKRTPTSSLYLDAEQNEEGRWVAFGFSDTNDPGLKFFGDFDGKVRFAGSKEEVLSACKSYEDRNEALIAARTGWFAAWINEQAEAIRSFDDVGKPTLKLHKGD